MRNRARLAGLLASIFWAGGAALCQTSGPKTFEVSSVKAVAPETQNIRGNFACRGIDGTIPDKVLPVGREIPLGRCTGVFNLKFIIAYAYDIDPGSVTGGPTWAIAPTSPIAGGIAYEIEAAAEHTASATRSDLHEMLQHLLEDRFKLKVHRSAKAVPGYALLVGKNGPKLKPSAADAPEAYKQTAPDAERVRSVTGNGSMADLAKILGMILKGSVADRTGLTGMYEFSFTYPMQPEISTSPSVFTTIQDLGLRLDSVSDFSQPILVIDTAEKPAPDPR